MFTVAKKAMTASRAMEYYSKDGLGYYLEEGAHFVGEGAKALGLDTEKQATMEEFRAIVAGCDPQTGKPLIETKGEGGEHRAGLDGTFSAPKSASILAAAGDERVKGHFRDAVMATVGFIEKNQIQARYVNEEGKQVSVDTKSLVGLLTEHMTNRSDDMQLHAHLFMANMTLRPDGQWRATHNDMIYNDQMSLGIIFRNELAHRLQKDGYGIEVSNREQALFEVVGVPKELIDEFSQRSKEIDAKYEEMKDLPRYRGWSEADVKDHLAIITRDNKSHLSPAELQKQWNDRAEKREYSLEAVRATVEQLREQNLKNGKEIPESAAETLQRGIANVQKQHSTFTPTEAIAAAMKGNFGAHSLDALQDRFDRDTVPLGRGFVGDHKGNRAEMYSTQGMIDTERRILDHAERGAGAFKPVATREEVQAFLDRKHEEKTTADPNFKGFKTAQREYVLAVLTGTNGTLVVQGDPGTGKTTSRGLIEDFNKEVLRAEGRPEHKTIGVGFTGKAAAEIAARGVEASTIERFLNQEIRIVEGRPDPKATGEIQVSKGSSVEILVDEASMVSSRDMDKVMARVDELREKGVNIKLTLSGDTKQLSPVGEGRVFDEIQSQAAQSIDRIHLDEIVRQREGSYGHDVATLASKGDMKGAFERLREGANGETHLFEMKDRAQLQEAAVAKYLEKSADGSEGFMLTPLNADRKETNQAIREQRVANGQIAAGETYTIHSPAGIMGTQAFAADNYAPGQQVVYTGTKDRRGKTLRSDRSGIPANSVGTVTGVNVAANEISVKYTDRHGKTLEKTHSLAKDWERLSVYSQEERQFSVGDRIAFTKNDKNLGVMNGNLGTVTDITDGVITADVEGKEKKFAVTEEAAKSTGLAQYTHFDHGYAITFYKSQGGSPKFAIPFLPVKPRDGRENDINSLRDIMGMDVSTAAFDKFKTTLTADEQKYALDGEFRGYSVTAGFALGNVARPGEETRIEKVVTFTFHDAQGIIKDHETRQGKEGMAQMGMHYNSDLGAWITAVTNQKALEGMGSIHPLNDPEGKKIAKDALDAAEKGLDKGVDAENIPANKIGDERDAVAREERFSRASRQAVLVALSRGVESTDVFTTDVKVLIEQANTPIVNRSTLSGLVRENMTSMKARTPKSEPTLSVKSVPREQIPQKKTATERELDRVTPDRDAIGEKIQPSAPDASASKADLAVAGLAREALNAIKKAEGLAATDMAGGGFAAHREANAAVGKFAAALEAQEKKVSSELAETAQAAVFKADELRMKRAAGEGQTTADIRETMQARREVTAAETKFEAIESRLAEGKGIEAKNEKTGAAKSPEKGLGGEGKGKANPLPLNVKGVDINGKEFNVFAERSAVADFTGEFKKESRAEKSLKALEAWKIKDEVARRVPLDLKTESALLEKSRAMATEKHGSYKSLDRAGQREFRKSADNAYRDMKVAHVAENKLLPRRMEKEIRAEARQWAMEKAGVSHVIDRTRSGNYKIHERTEKGIESRTVRDEKVNPDPVKTKAEKEANFFKEAAAKETPEQKAAWEKVATWGQEKGGKNFLTQAYENRMAEAKANVQAQKDLEANAAKSTDGFQTIAEKTKLQGSEKFASQVEKGGAHAGRWDATIDGAGYQWSKDGERSFVSAQTARHQGVMGATVRTETRYIESGEHKGSVSKSSSERVGNYHKKTETITRANGQKIEAKEHGYRSDVYSYTHREEMTNGAKKISDTHSLGGFVWGKTTTIGKDGVIRETKWRGHKTLGGNLQIDSSTTTTSVDKERANRELNGLANYMIDKSVEKAVGLANKIAERFNPDKAAAREAHQDMISKALDLEKGRGHDSDVKTIRREDGRGNYTETGTVARRDGVRVDVNEQGWKRGNASHYQRMETIRNGADAGDKKLTTCTTFGNHRIGETTTLRTDGRVQKTSWTQERQADGSWKTTKQEKSNFLEKDRGSLMKAQSLKERVNTLSREIANKVSDLDKKPATAENTKAGHKDINDSKLAAMEKTPEIKTEKSASIGDTKSAKMENTKAGAVREVGSVAGAETGKTSTGREAGIKESSTTGDSKDKGIDDTKSKSKNDSGGLGLSL